MRHDEAALGATVRALAGMHGVTIAELASAVGISRQAMDAIVNYRSLPSLPTGNMIAIVFGVGTDDLFDVERAVKRAAEVYGAAPIRKTVEARRPKRKPAKRTRKGKR